MKDYIKFQNYFVINDFLIICHEMFIIWCFIVCNYNSIRRQALMITSDSLAVNSWGVTRLNKGIFRVNSSELGGVILNELS